MYDQVRKYVLGNVDSEQIDRKCSLPHTVLDDFRKLGLFGSRLPNEHGGLDLTATEHIRLLESFSVDSALAVQLNTHHSIAFQGILESASSDLRNMYLPRISSGELKATICISEEMNEIDFSCINTVATKGPDGYYLTGKKTWVLNGDNSDLFLVLAKVVEPKKGEVSDESYAAFLVEKNYPGIKLSDVYEKHGLKGAKVCSVEFHEVPVPLENVIGSNGHETFRKIACMNRFHIGALTTGLAKTLTDLLIDHCINTKLFLKPLSDYELYKNKIGKMVCKTYAMESVTYFTAGLFDSTEEPDLDLEYSAVKVFCTESLSACANEILSVIGQNGSLLGHPVERIVRDSRMWLLMESPNDMIRQYITLSSLNHHKRDLAALVQKLRNLVFYPKFGLQKYWEDFRHQQGNVKLKMDLQGYLHPSLELPAYNLEYSVCRLKHAFERLLQHAGPESVNRGINLCRLGEMAIEILVMTAVCSRASRSYSIGLPSAKLEVTLAISYCHGGFNRVNKLHDEVWKSPAGTTDADYQEVAKEVLRKKGYCFTPPFTRNY